MFDDVFSQWLESKAAEVIRKMDKEKLSPEEMIVLVLKAQANHFAHLDQDLRREMQLLREDMNRRFEQVDRWFEQVDRRFEQMKQRFAEIDKRFEQIDRRFSQLYTFLQWLMGLLVSSAVAILVKLFWKN